jgi:hypothetical protein
MERQKRKKRDDQTERGQSSFLFFLHFKSLIGKISEKNNCSLKLKKHFTTATSEFSRDENKFRIKKNKK